MKVGIVFEGGAFRTIFSCGVIDALLTNEIYCDYMIGVSAGAGYGVSYATRQNKRNIKIIMKYCDDKRYYGLKNWFDKDNKSVFGLDFVYNTVPNKLVCFDYDAFKKYNTTFLCVGTNVETGKADYFPFDPNDKNMVALQATCALPVVFPKIELNGNQYLDGGITDAIPFKKAMADGCEKVIVVSTREKGFRKTSNKKLRMFLPIFKKNPNLYEALSAYTSTYNATMDELDEYEKRGDVFVFRPKTTFGVKMLDTNKLKLMKLYNDGYNQTYKRLDELKEYLAK